MTELDNSHIVSLTLLLNFRYARNPSHLRAVATLNESYFICQQYTNDTLYQDVGKEGCIPYDVVLGSSGCKPVADWTMPHLIHCPNTIKNIAKIYQEGNVYHGVKKHHSSNFFDRREQSAGKYQQKKRWSTWLISQPPKCQQ